MGLKKGHKKVGGRVAGTPNKFTQTVKEVFSNVFNELQNDSKVNLKAWAKANPTDFYRLSIKLMPFEVSTSVDNQQVQLVIHVDNEEHKKMIENL